MSSYHNSPDIPESIDFSSFHTYPLNGTFISIDWSNDGCQMGLEPAHPIIKVFLTICFTLVIIFCGLGNCILTFIIFTQKRLRSVTNLLIANLAVSDAFVAMLCAPFALHYYLHDNWVFGDVMCPVVGTVKFISFFVSVNTLLVIAVDR